MGHAPANARKDNDANMRGRVLAGVIDEDLKEIMQGFQLPKKQ